MAQREMNREPSHFVPVKYGPANDGQTSSVNLLVGGTFALLLFALYRRMHGKRGGSGSIGKDKKGGSGGGFGGGGGINDLMGMSKSGA